MPTPTALTDVVIIIAVLLGSVTAGIMLIRPLRHGRPLRTSRRPGTPDQASRYSSARVRRRGSKPAATPWSTGRARRPW